VTYTFAEFTLDAGERRLSADGRDVAVPPKAFDLLVALVDRAGRLVTKQDLLDAVWPDAHVEEGILAVHVSNLRKSLGDAGPDHRFIETVSKTGYRFRAEVARLHPRQDDYSMRWPVGVLAAQPEVYELIGRGRAHLLTYARPDVPKAVDAFRQAIELDPSYAAAHAGLARACCAQAELRVIPHTQAYADAKVSALRALAMDSANADAQVALGTVLFLSDWNWEAARRCFERALELDPSHIEGCLMYGRLLEALGELDRALAVKQKALEQDPASALVHLQIAQSFWNHAPLRRHDFMANRALDLDPNHPLAREYLASAYWKLGDFDRQMDESLKHARTHGVPDAIIAELEQVYARNGRRGILEHAIRLAGPAGNAVQLAILSSELGRLDDAFRYLDAALDSRDPSLVHLAVAPQWDHLRPDPRFAARLARMDLVCKDSWRHRP
jgi:DNA-binding winged helix-turn-helix (wHTH) protein/tetratricopeptide (TPR) repeat protein